ncbi:MAG: hypothetical protein EOO38_23265 [Cytophagaceae bacterium]|nr:MAG: hypothetical protein EOO38_23265 [Cytophagaceae bacterium]
MEDYKTFSKDFVKRKRLGRGSDGVVYTYCHCASGIVTAVKQPLDSKNTQSFKVAALLDSDTAGDQAANQDALVHVLGSKAIIRTKDVYTGPVVMPEIEDLLRDTLVKVAKESLSIDVTAEAASELGRPIIDLLKAASNNFSKYKLAKAYIRWVRDHTASELADIERSQFKLLIDKINKALK